MLHRLLCFLFSLIFLPQPSLFSFVTFCLLCFRLPTSKLSSLFRFLTLAFSLFAYCHCLLIYDFRFQISDFSNFSFQPSDFRPIPASNSKPLSSLLRFPVLRSPRNKIPPACLFRGSYRPTSDQHLRCRRVSAHCGQTPEFLPR